jgi:hypothetical protein
MLPYLEVKQDEAEVALAYQALVAPYGSAGIPDDIRAQRQSLDERLRYLKRREYSPETLAARAADEYFGESELQMS